MLAALTALTGCSGGGGSQKQAKANDGVLTIAKDGPRYPKNFNWYGANQNGTVPGLHLLYESPFELDAQHPGKLTPKLAESYEMEDGGSTMVFHVRKGVKWSDGTEMSAKDFAYTFNFVNGDACPDPTKCWAKKPAEATDQYTAKVYFNGPEFQQIANYAMYYPIYPEHIWTKRDRKTDINQDAVGTGPFKVKSFDPQQVVYSIRDDYWGGKGNGVKEVKFIPYGTAGGVQAQLNRGEIDLAEGSAPGVMKDYVALNKDLNHYTVYPGGGSQLITMNATKLPTSDIAVRTALRDSLDLQAAADLSGVGFTVPSVVGLDTKVYADSLLPEFKEPHKGDVEKAKKTLADAGWTVVDGNLTKDGKAYPLSLNVDNGHPTWMQLGQVYTDQWQKALGIKVAWAPTPTQVFNKQAVLGNYTLFASGGIANGNYYQAYAQYSKGNLRPIGSDENVWGNYGRWANVDVQKATKAMQAIKPDDTDAMKPIAETIQKAVATEAPYIPAMTSTNNIMWSSRKWTGLPDPGTSPWIPAVGNLNATIDLVMALKPAQ